ncbi:hypothetical protein CO178_00950, partial [candidate division WWE3 bacterium CG_4_9_14_3_um_filter_34_6]
GNRLAGGGENWRCRPASPGRRNVGHGRNTNGSISPRQDSQTRPIFDSNNNTERRDHQIHPQHGRRTLAISPTAIQQRQRLSSPPHRCAQDRIPFHQTRPATTVVGKGDEGRRSPPRLPPPNPQLPPPIPELRNEV